MKQTLDFVESLVVVALVMTGLGGIFYHLLREDGWMEKIFGSTWDFTVRYPLIAVPLVIGGLVLGKMWRDDRVAHGKQSSKAGTAMLYLILAAGVYFVGHFFLNGSF